MSVLLLPVTGDQQQGERAKPVPGGNRGQRTEIRGQERQWPGSSLTSDLCPLTSGSAPARQQPTSPDQAGAGRGVLGQVLPPVGDLPQPDRAPLDLLAEPTE